MTSSTPAGIVARKQVSGVVLAGGLGRRMSADGEPLDKGLRPFLGRPMIAHVIERLEPQVAELIVNANRALDRYRALGHRVVSDSVSGFAGPLAGLHAGLQATRTPWVVTAPCDSPFLPLDLVERLAAAASRAGSVIAVARTGAQPHPVFALVARDVLPGLTRFLESGQRKIDAWYASLATVEVDFDDERAFENINTPDDLARLQRAEAGRTGRP